MRFGVTAKRDRECCGDTKVSVKKLNVKPFITEQNTESESDTRPTWYE